jgi:hypothetical protein
MRFRAFRLQQRITKHTLVGIICLSFSELLAQLASVVKPDHLCQGESNKKQAGPLRPACTKQIVYEKKLQSTLNYRQSCVNVSDMAG